MKIKKIKTALISVSNKKKITMMARKLIQKKIKLFATQGTANILKKKKIKVTNISDYIQFPEILEGKIKTLHPKIYGGLLAKSSVELNLIKKYKIKKFDLIIVNFYKLPKKNEKKYLKTIANYIDIGGPSIIRAAVKNYKKKIIITKIKDYIKIINHIQHDIYINNNKHLKLAIKAFKYNISYDMKILNIICKNKKNVDKIFPKKIKIHLIKQKNLRYGENKHQKSALYIDKKIIKKKPILFYKQIQGLKLSYNNISDAEIACDCVQTIQKFGCVIVKHGNPCGVAIGKNLLQAYKNAYKTDPISCFGGIIALNEKVNSQTIQYILNKQFLEIIIAPKISNKARNIIKNKKNIRVLIYKKKRTNILKNELEIRSINGKFLLQTKDNINIDINTCKFVTYKKPTKKEIKDLIFAWKIVKFTKSNSVIYVKNLITTAIGSGQTSRIDAIKVAHMKAKQLKKNLKKNVLASDAFFPFRDSIDEIASKKISCIIQPGGSIRDNEVIKAANDNNIAMIFTYTRHFKH
ncbi:bifunctional phosphoribosylaminoimidazolecarboxamide formyltransferase/IMP cyclohydrolase [Buchnera aphidicola (Mollitrichosiphum nigrofasciatum)]|uniref:bifunctional phosphoribosylaminoimidazolecarboxamide formyltransferase/IMP cyclohydrolase n=1 Tax=Buchnera aphidicola TaxID=9 RepID=UPI0031B88AB8